MIQEFNDLPWHDAELKEIILKRDQNDIVRIIIRWPDYYEASTVIIDFIDCYALQADMHFGVVPPDCILEANCIDESQELNNIKKIWAKIGLDLSGLHCYQIKTNSTNSIISIFALGFEIKNINSS